MVVGIVVVIAVAAAFWECGGLRCEPRRLARRLPVFVVIELLDDGAEENDDCGAVCCIVCLERERTATPRNQCNEMRITTSNQRVG